MELDHIFICTQKGAPEAELLTAFGLIEGSSNIHKGQGTKNRRFFFKNFFIELLWLENLEEVQSYVTSPTLLYERLSSKNAKVSPFGVCFRQENKSETTSQFPSWNYSPIYLPSNLKVEIYNKLSIFEPMFFFLSVASRPDILSSQNKQTLNHRIGFSEMTCVQICMPQLLENEHWFKKNRIENLIFIEGDEHKIEITFDHAKHSVQHDFRPQLPLIFNY